MCLGGQPDASEDAAVEDDEGGQGDDAHPYKVGHQDVAAGVGDVISERTLSSPLSSLSPLSSSSSSSPL